MRVRLLPSAPALSRAAPNAAALSEPRTDPQIWRPRGEKSPTSSRSKGVISSKWQKNIPASRSLRTVDRGAAVHRPLQVCLDASAQSSVLRTGRHARGPLRRLHHQANGRSCRLCARGEGQNERTGTPFREKEKEDLFKRLSSQRSGFARAARKTFYVNCWHVIENESAAMWKLYTSMNDAICVRSTYKQLWDCLSDTECFLGSVSYINYDTDAFDEGNTFKTKDHEQAHFRVMSGRCARWFGKSATPWRLILSLSQSAYRLAWSQRPSSTKFTSRLTRTRSCWKSFRHY